MDKRPPIGFDMIKANDGCHSDYWMTEEDLYAYFASMVLIYELANIKKDKFKCKIIL